VVELQAADVTLAAVDARVISEVGGEALEDVATDAIVASSDVGPVLEAVRLVPLAAAVPATRLLAIGPQRGGC
jgi:hypothetical protein